MNSSANRKWPFGVMFFCIFLNEFKTLQNLVEGLIFNQNIVDTVFMEDYDVVISFWVINSDDITFRSWNSTGVEQVFVSRSTKRLLSSDVILWQCTIDNLQSYSIELEGHLSSKLKLR